MSENSKMAEFRAMVEYGEAHSVDTFVRHLVEDYDRQQWALDNIYTIAIREERHGGERAKGWAHVRRLCERFGCAVRAVRPAGKDGEQKYGYAEDAKAEAK